MTAPWSPDIDRAVRGGPRGGSLAEWKAHSQSLLARQPCVFVRNGPISALYAALYLRRPERFHGYSLRRGTRPPGRSGPPLMTSSEDRWAWLEGSIMPRFRRYDGAGEGLRHTLTAIVREARGHAPRSAHGESLG